MLSAFIVEVAHHRSRVSVNYLDFQALFNGVSSLLGALRLLLLGRPHKELVLSDDSSLDQPVLHAFNQMAERDVAFTVEFVTVESPFAHHFQSCLRKLCGSCR